MEINLNNAFLVLLKLTLGFYTKYFDDLTKFVARQCYSKTLWLLRKPLLTTYLFTCILLLIFGLITYSMLLVVAVACIVTVIILVQGLILGVIFVLAWSCAITCMGLIVNVITIRISYSTKHYEEDEE